MNRLSRLNDQAGQAGPRVDSRIEGLVSEASRTIANLQSLLAHGPEHREEVTNVVAIQPACAPDNLSSFDLHRSVRTAKNLRNLRKRMLGEEVFTGPAWGILLELFESYILQRTDTVGQVCVSSDVPAATVLRWLNRLSDSGLVTMHDDHLDRRRRFVELSANGIHLMTQYFSGTEPHVVAA